MPKSKPAYPPDFRAEAVRLAQSGQQSTAQTACDLGVSYEALRGWIKRADLDAGRRSDGLTSVERDELTRVFDNPEWGLRHSRCSRWGRLWQNSWDIGSSRAIGFRSSPPCAFHTLFPISLALTCVS